MKKYEKFIISIAIVMITQATVYFCIKSFQTHFNVITSFIQVPVIKYFVYFYDSWYPFILFTSFIVFKHDKEAYFKLAITLMLSAFIAHITFLIYPTMVIRPENFKVETLTDWALYITYKTDTPAVNCLPSVHCLYCFIVSYYVIVSHNLKAKYKIMISIYSLLIILSTVFIAQHIVEDIILSLIYTILIIPFVYLLVKIFKKLLKK